MPLPLLAWGAIAVGVGWITDNAADAAGDGAKIVKWGVIGGGLYVSYRALKSAGAIK
jgi:hypothetical protein